MAASLQPGSYDRLKEVAEFDMSKAGVKGLVDSGIRKVPKMFIHPPEDDLPKPPPPTSSTGTLRVPVIDLEGVGDASRQRREVVESIRRASESWGFFQLVNHGIPMGLMDDTVRGMRMFHEQDEKVKAEFYSRESGRKVRYESNFDLYKSRAANWRDSLHCVFDGPMDPEEIPSACRELMVEYRNQVLKVVETIFALLSESLGLKPDYLESMNCAKMQYLLAHYYPPCPEPELTQGLSKHSDASLVTVVLQDSIGGLQVLHQEQWVDVTPVREALVVNIGEFLEILSNGRFKSAQHRVVSSREGPRISVAALIFPSNGEERLYGPIKEILSEENPPIYQEFLAREYLSCYMSRGLDEEPTITCFKL